MDYSDGQQVERGHDGPELVGPYTLIAQIATGDFTSVHLAQKDGALGFHRLSAIKRLKPEFARAPEWTQLLLDEARLSGVVRHPNIVDILDVGTDAGAYIVMEYIEGADLDILIARAGKERHPRYLVPPIVDALMGLHAVHTAKDELGESLSMVHQAPRARHILIGIDGISRITDFSQVSARGLIPSTLRGKRLALGYMAPEQVLVTEPVSARTDVFIAGITLWETLTGTQLFHADTPSLSRRAITERHIQRPSEVGLKPPRCFDDVCMKALQRNPELRYQSAEEMARELRDAAMNDALYASASELGQWVRALASRALVERRRALGSNAPSQEILLDAPGDVSSVHVSFASATPDESPSAPPVADTVAVSSTVRASAPEVAPLVTPSVVPARRTPVSTPVPTGAPARQTPVSTPVFSSVPARQTPVSTPAFSGAETDTFLSQLTEPARSSEQPAAEASAPPRSRPSSRTIDRAEIIADDPSRVARSRTVPPTSSRPGARPSSSIPAQSKATLMGVSPRPSASSMPPPALSATMGYGSPQTLHVEAKQEPLARRPRSAPPNATLPEGSFLRDLNVPQPTAPSARMPSRPASRPAPQPSYSQPSYSQPSYSQPAPAMGFADALAGDPHDHPPLHHAAGSAAYELPPVVVERQPGSGAFRTPASGLPAHDHGRRAPTRFPTSDGLVPADIFARVQAARQQAGESFRPPAYSGFDELDFEEGRRSKNGLASLLLVAAVLGAGFFGYRHYSNQLAPAPAVDPSVNAAAQAPVDPGPVDLGPPADELGASTPEKAEPALEVPEPVVPPPTLEAAPGDLAPPAARQDAPAYEPPAPRAQPARAQPSQTARPVAKRPRPAGPSYRPASRPVERQAGGGESLPDNPY